MVLEKKSPEIAATIKGAIYAIYKGQQKYSTYNGQTNQGPKHISFCFSPLLELMESALENKHD
ncbi:hypothetical protein [Legionella sp.]|uniref:hypothetical protein n=1 Tax=Legionella sp. TaxID=459 RepID=UPI003C83ED0B